MRYQTDKVVFLPGTADMFVQAAPDEWTVEQPGTPSVTVTAADLSAQGTRLIVLTYE